MNEELTGLLFDPFRLDPKLNFNSKLAAFGYDLIDQIGVKLRKRTHSTMDDRDLRSNTHGQMSKFEGYIPAANKQDPSRKVIMLQELFACRKVFDSRHLQVCWFSAGSNDDVPTLQRLLANPDR